MTTTPDPFNLIITGVGGQGNVLASQMIGRTLLKKGYQITIGETYGLSQRGGAVLSHVRISRTQTLGPLIPKNMAHAIVGLEPVETLRVLPAFGNPDVLVVANSRPVYPMGVIAGERTYPDLGVLRQRLAELSKTLFWVDATRLAMDLGNAIMTNVIMIGALIQTGIMPLTPDDLFGEIESSFPKTKWEENKKALKAGIEAVAALAAPKPTF